MVRRSMFWISVFGVSGDKRGEEEVFKDRREIFGLDFSITSYKGISMSLGNFAYGIKLHH